MKVKNLLLGVAVLAVLIVGASGLNHFMGWHGKAKVAPEMMSKNFNKFLTFNVTEEMMSNPEYFDEFSSYGTLGAGASGSSGGSGGSDSTGLTVLSAVISNGIITVNNLAFVNATAADANVDTTATITAKVTKNTAYTITINDGNNFSSGTASQRDMTDGSSNYLSYEVYKDSGHSNRWGSSASEDINGTGDGTDDTYTAYGRIAIVGWSVPVGGYSDTLTVTLSY